MFMSYKECAFIGKSYYKQFTVFKLKLWTRQQLADFS